MAKFYGQVVGMSNTPATRRGGKDIQSSAQSYDGSITTRLWYDDDTLMVSIRVCEQSGFYGDLIFQDTFEKYVEVLKGATNNA